MNNFAEKYLRKEALPFIFCPGCGHGVVLNSFLRAVDTLQIKDDMALVSGIGCSSWAPVYVECDVLHSLHGRAIPCAEGLKITNPDKKIIVFTGDGDAVGIGGNHLIHAARRNIDLTVIIMTNNIYGMTGGQKAPTTPHGSTTKTSPYGNDEYPFDIYKLAVGAGATFFARWTTAHPIQLERAIVDAINHKGFSCVEVLSQCPTQAGKNLYGTNDPVAMMKHYKNSTYIFKKGSEIDTNEKIPLGILYETQRNEFIESMSDIHEKGETL